jgi:hypothetical protein
MHFQAHAAGFLKPLADLSLLNVWDIQARELSEQGRDVLRILEQSDAKIKSDYHRLAWTGQAILEFQDLQQIILPESGPFLHINYLFFQSLDTLRQAVLTGLNGQTQASFAILRSALENFVFHYWWRSVLLKERTFEAYYAWLRGEPPKIKVPTFARVIADTFARLDLPRDAIDLDTFKALYDQLCSYVHKPLLAESLTTIRGGNIPGVSHEETLYWLDFANRTQRALLDLGIGNSPQALFPIDIHRKFGFSTPVGALFDHSNFIPLKEALGDDITLNYQKHYETRNPPKDTLHWAESHRDLTDEEILNSWSGRNEPDDADKPFDLRIFHRYTQLKAETRAELFIFSNGDIDHSFDWGTSEGIITFKHERRV